MPLGLLNWQRAFPSRPIYFPLSLFALFHAGESKIGGDRVKVQHLGEELRCNFIPILPIENDPSTTGLPVQAAVNPQSAAVSCWISAAEFTQHLSWQANVCPIAFVVVPAARCTSSDSPDRVSTRSGNYFLPSGHPDADNLLSLQSGKSPSPMSSPWQAKKHRTTSD